MRTTCTEYLLVSDIASFAVPITPIQAAISKIKKNHIWLTLTADLLGTGALVSVKVMRNKNTQISLGYGFLEFSSHETASDVLERYNNTPMPGTHSNFRHVSPKFRACRRVLPVPPGRTFVFAWTL